jgi:sulfatase maturation enzyme AslB (radical SAM superfamily)
MNNNVDLKNYICDVPFSSLEIHNNVCFLCCPSWLPNKVELSEIPLKDVYNSEPVVDIRNSILDGSFKYCNKELCPYLNKLINYGVTSGPVRLKEESIPYSTIIKNGTPDYLVMNFDRTCNYKCPSCRVDLIVEDSKGIQRVEKTIEDIDTYYSANVKTLYITGSGDPFVSVGFRNYLRNFNQKKYPKLRSIHLHTNASMWNKEMWDSMPNIHKYVRTCEISIDAATKDTYENKTRLGGNWENLLNNLNFINTLPINVKTSFVVQDTNYMEMETFYNLMYSIFGNKVNVFFGKITNWGTFSEGEFKLKQVWDINHPEHQLFKKEFNKVWKNQNLFHNLYEFIDNNTKKTLI